MDEYTAVASLRERLARERNPGRRIALVPTMGALHAGHLRLVEAARDEHMCVVMSIFVNPLQFGAGEDLERYPRTLEQDRALASAGGVDVLFVPAPGEMYPGDLQVRVTAGTMGSLWEGALRPGHFDGVLTVVAKLFNQVRPDLAYFGQKDIQQYTLLRQMTRDLDVPVQLRMVRTVRDADGLALSSRNVYLSSEDRSRALALPRALGRAERRWRDGEHDAGALRQGIADDLATDAGLVADYIAVIDPVHLASVPQAVSGSIVAVAARVGPTRLIDNVILQEHRE